jgi:hypothetical protein
MPPNDQSSAATATGTTAARSAALDRRRCGCPLQALARWRLWELRRMPYSHDPDGGPLRAIEEPVWRDDDLAMRKGWKLWDRATRRWESL